MENIKGSAMKSLEV